MLARCLVGNATWSGGLEKTSQGRTLELRSEGQVKSGSPIRKRKGF